MTASRFFVPAALLLAVSGTASSTDTGGFCSAQRSLLAATEDSFVVSRQRSCRAGEEWLDVPKPTTVDDILYRVHDLEHDGNQTSLAAWFKANPEASSGDPAAAHKNRTRGNVPPPQAKARTEHVWLSNRTEAERIFQDKMSAALLGPLLEFSAKLGRSAEPVDVTEFLKQLVSDRQLAVMEALREVSGNRTLDRLLRQKGGVVRALSQSISEVILLGDEISHRVDKLTSVRRRTMKPAKSSSPPAGSSAPSSADGSKTSTEGPAGRSVRVRSVSTLSVPLPTAFSTATAAVMIPAVLVIMHMLFGVPAAFVLASVAYAGFLLLWSVAFGLSRSPLLMREDFDAGTLLGKTVEVVAGGFLRSRLLRTALLYILEHITSV